jgi:hypothetical protein
MENVEKLFVLLVASGGNGNVHAGRENAAIRRSFLVFVAEGWGNVFHPESLFRRMFVSL